MSVTARRYAITDPDVTAWRRAVYQYGGSVSDARLDIVEAFVSAEKGAGNWRVTDDYLALWGENERQGLVSLKQLRLATLSATIPTFTPDRGHAFNGTSSYIDMGFIPDTHAAQMTVSNLRVAVYERTAVSADANSVGCNSTTTNSIWLRARTAGGNLLARLASSNGSDHSISTSLGFSACSRTGGSATVKAYRNGVALAEDTVTAGSTLPSVSLYVGARNNNGTAASFRATSIGFVCIGAPLSDEQEAAQYAAVLAWATAIGAQV